MKRTTLWLSVAVLAPLVVALGVFASNMAFKLSVTLYGPTGGTTGTTLLALPFIRQAGLDTASDLLNDISSTHVTSVIRWVTSNDSISFYSGSGGDNFALVEGQAYLIQVNTDLVYIIAGSHDPAFSVPLYGPQGGSSGLNTYAYPFHSTASTAGELIDEINVFTGTNAVVQISRYVNSTDTVEFYTGFLGTNFSLVPGEGYFIQVRTDVSFVPAHY